MASGVKLVEGKESPVIDTCCDLQESLPLFAGGIFSGSMHSGPVDLYPNERNWVINQGDNVPMLQKRASSLGRQDHLACAKRLSWAMRQIPTNSRQHIQAGRLVCHHLVAMLHESPVHSLRMSGK